jgi:phenylalanine-4-hydroxylase
LAKESENVATYVYSSGLQISGKITAIHTNNSEVSYIQTAGSTALSFKDQQLLGHGIDYHKDGFGSPVGKIKGFTKSLEDFSDSELNALSISQNLYSQLEFESGIYIKGKVKNILRKNGKIILVTFTDCTVTNHKNETLFQPAWGVYDMAVGSRIISVFSGTADKTKFNILPEKSKSKAIPIEHTSDEKKLFSFYNQIRQWREKNSFTYNDIKKLYTVIQNNFKNDWLIRLELLEMLKKTKNESGIIDDINTDLSNLMRQSDEYKSLIESGLNLLNKKTDAIP